MKTKRAPKKATVRRSNQDNSLARRGVLLAALVLFAGLGTYLSLGSHAATSLSVNVSGNKLIDGNGKPLRLLGVDKGGSEYACASGWGFFDGPTDQASIDQMKTWKINAVRVPLNEDCWLGINGVKSTYSGSAYQTAINDYVNRLNANGIIAIIDLHWSAPGTTLAKSQQVMADADHSPAFWRSAASYFKSNTGVMFDMYNEPHDVSWSCWRDGCTTSAGWQTAGMQSLVDAVRGTGATQPIIASGLSWANDLSGWDANKPTDKLNRLVAGFHLYNTNACSNTACWDAQVGPVAAATPIVTTELGEHDCGSSFINSYFNWADSRGISYVGWAWNTYDCAGGPALIQDKSGTPTVFGTAMRDHFISLAALDASVNTGTTSPTSTPTGVTATLAVPNNVNLQWNSLPNVTSYRIQRDTAGITVGRTNSTSFQETNVAAGVHHYSVYGWDNVQKKEVLVGKAEITIPTATSNTAATATFVSATDVHLEWQAAAGITTYRIQRDTAGITVGRTNDTRFDDKTVNGGSHTYRIYGWDAANKKEVLVATASCSY